MLYTLVVQIVYLTQTSSQLLALASDWWTLSIWMKHNYKVEYWHNVVLYSRTST